MLNEQVLSAQNLPFKRITDWLGTQPDGKYSRRKIRPLDKPFGFAIPSKLCSLSRDVGERVTVPRSNIFVEGGGGGRRGRVTSNGRSILVFKANDSRE